MIYAADNVIIAQFIGPEAVTQYAIPYQLFSFSLIIFNIIIAPLWPAYSEALARGDLAWVRTTLNRSLIFILLTSVCISLFLIIFAQTLLNFWVGLKIVPSWSLNLPLGIWMVVLTCGSAISIVLHAANIFKFQIIFVFLTILSCLLFKCTFIYYYGLPGIVWGTILAYSLFFLLPYSIFLYKLVNEKIIIYRN